MRTAYGELTAEAASGNVMSGSQQKHRVRRRWTLLHKEVVRNPIAATAAQVARRLAISVTVVSMYFIPYYSTFLRDESRYASLWNRSDALCFLAVPLLIGLLGGLAAILIRSIGGNIARRIVDHLFLLFLGGALITIGGFQASKIPALGIQPNGTEILTAWMLLFAIVGYSYARPNPGLVQWSSKLCLVFTPVSLIIAVQLVLAPEYPARMDPLPALPGEIDSGVSPAANEGTATAEPTPVFWFVFDEWAYDRTFPNDRLDPRFSRLQDFASQAITFSKAVSGGTRTSVSLPRILLQTELEPTHLDGRVGFRQNGTFMPADRFETIFSLVDDRPHERIVIGMHLPHNLWVGHEVDYCRTYPFNARGRNLLEYFAILTLCSADQMSGPWFGMASKSLGPPLSYEHYRDLNHQIRADIEHVLASGRRDLFCLMHCNLPHKPFIYNADGTLKPFSGSIYANSPENYEAHLCCLDRWIGEFIGTLREAGTYDESLIILTSDHGWRADPLRRYVKDPDPKDHVPLLIKLPHQHAPLVIDREYKLNRIAPLIAHALDHSSPDPRQAIPAIMQSVVEESPGM